MKRNITRKVNKVFFAKPGLSRHAGKPRLRSYWATNWSSW